MRLSSRKKKKTDVLPFVPLFPYAQKLFNRRVKRNFSSHWAGKDFYFYYGPGLGWDRIFSTPVSPPFKKNKDKDVLHAFYFFNRFIYNAFFYLGHRGDAVTIWTLVQGIY